MEKIAEEFGSCMLIFLMGIGMLKLCLQLLGMASAC